MVISNLLIIPSDNSLASEVFLALRYEKTVRLYAGNILSKTNSEPHTPHRMVSVGPLPPIADTEFQTSLDKALSNVAINYIVPTTPEAYEYFSNQSVGADVLKITTSANDTWHRDADLMLDCYSNCHHEPIFVGARHKFDDVWQSQPVYDACLAAVKKLSIEHNITGPWSASYSEQDQSIQIASKGLVPEMALFRNLGANFMLLALHEARGNKVATLPIGGTARLQLTNQALSSIDIEYASVFLDLDDTLIIHGAVNDTIISFIYHCRAKGIPIHLITRHYREPALTLADYGIAEDLFECIIWITDGTPKSHYMVEADNPIFIDDAFSERKEVSEKLNIACLAPDMVSALLADL